jgi:Mg-chelatase subunit ChlD
MIKLLTSVDKSFVPPGYPVRVFVNAVFVSEEDGNAGGSSGPISSYILLDCSGSMEGEKLWCAKSSVTEYIKTLRPTDDLTLMTFGGNVQTLLRKSMMNETGKSEAVSLINDVKASSNTPMFNALKAAYEDVRSSNATNAPRGLANNLSENNRVIRILLITDGQPTDVDPESKIREYADIARGFRIQNASLISLGIGEDYNQDLLLKLNQANEGGQTEHITDPANQMGKICSKIASDAQNVVLSSTKLQVKLNKGVIFDGAYKIHPQVQELVNSVNRDDNVLTFQVGDVIIGEGPEICLSFFLPSRPDGEYREVSFMVEGNIGISSPLIVSRVSDSVLINNKQDRLPEAKYEEARLKVLQLKVMQGEERPTLLLQPATKLRADPELTKLMSPGIVQQIDATINFGEHPESVDKGTVMMSKSETTKMWRRQ